MGNPLIELTILQALAFGCLLSVGTILTLPAKTMGEAEPAWYNCLTFEVFSPEKQIWCDRWQTLQTASYIVPTRLDSTPEYTTVTLENGRYHRENDQLDEHFIVELVNERGWMALGDLNSDGKEDAAVIFGVALDPEGQAIATYLTAVLDVDDLAQSLTPIRLGERIMLNAPISIANDRITVPFLTQTEAFDRHYAIENLALIEAPQTDCP